MQKPSSVKVPTNTIKPSIKQKNTEKIVKTKSIITINIRKITVITTHLFEPTVLLTFITTSLTFAIICSKIPMKYQIED
jgi:hypothetical protein